jgi:hypothetical protein
VAADISESSPTFCPFNNNSFASRFLRESARTRTHTQYQSILPEINSCHIHYLKVKIKKWRLIGKKGLETEGQKKKLAEKSQVKSHLLRESPLRGFNDVLRLMHS